jgi:hypothetical protein
MQGQSEKKTPRLPRIHRHFQRGCKDLWDGSQPCPRFWDFRGLDFVEFVEALPLGQASGAVETLAALAAPVGEIGQEEKNPKFQNAAAFGAMHVVASAKRASSIRSVKKQAEGTFHWERMIAFEESGHN